MITVNLEDIIDAIEEADMDSNAWLNRTNGEIEWDPEEDEDVIALPGKRERDDYHNMELFIERLDDPEAQDWLSNAIHGRGAFRMFRAACEKFHLLNDWYDFEDRMHRVLAIDWCEQNGILYDTHVQTEEEEDSGDLSDFLHEDYSQPARQPSVQEIRVPVHIVGVSEDNLMNALYVNDAYRREVLKMSSDLDQAEADLRDALDQNCHILAASDRGRFIGLMIYEEIRDRILLHEIYVMKDQRRKGVGRMLMQAMREETKNTGRDFSLLIDPHNTGALQFFAEEGWIQSPYVELCREN
jgi:ribosomal protein S18 acetylase RimI-like enzyme